MHLGNAQEHDFTGDSAVIPPVERHGRNSLRTAFVVYFESDEVVPFPEEGGDIGLERGERAVVLRHLLSVEPHAASHAHAREIQDTPAAFLTGGIEMAGVPYGPFIPAQAFILVVPVSRNIQFQSAAPAEFQEFGLGGWLAVQEKLFPGAGIILVYDGLPLSVKGHPFTGIRIHYEAQDKKE